MGLITKEVGSSSLDDDVSDDDDSLRTRDNCFVEATAFLIVTLGVMCLSMDDNDSTPDDESEDESRLVGFVACFGKSDCTSLLVWCLAGVELLEFSFFTENVQKSLHYSWLEKEASIYQ